MGLIRWIGSIVASFSLFCVAVVVGGLLALIGYFAGAIFIGACIVGGVACVIHELFFDKS